MFEKIIETLFIRKKEYKRSKITVLRNEKYYNADENSSTKLMININTETTTCLSKYFALRKGLNVVERKYYNNINIIERNRRLF